MKTAFKQDACFLGVCGHQPFPPLDWKLSSLEVICWQTLCRNSSRSSRPIHEIPAMLSGKWALPGSFRAKP